MTTAIYKVVRNIKHPTHGWITLGRFVRCRPEYAKNYVIRREMVRCSSEQQDSVDALWIDNQPDPKLAPKTIAQKAAPSDSATNEPSTSAKSVGRPKKKRKS